MSMTTFLNIGSSSILIESDEINGTDEIKTSSVPAAAAFVRTLKALSREITSSLSDMDASSKPSELNVTFDLKLASGGHFMIIDRANKGNFSVHMKFHSMPKAELPA